MKKKELETEHNMVSFLLYDNSTGYLRQIGKYGLNLPGSVGLGALVLPQTLENCSGFYREVSQNELEGCWEERREFSYRCSYVSKTDGLRHLIIVTAVPAELPDRPSESGGKSSLWFLAARQIPPESAGSGQKEDELAERSSMLSSLSHELRTPLNSIIGLVTIALMETGMGERLSLYLKRIKEQASFLVDLVNNILEMSRLESGRLQLEESSVSIDSLLQSIWELFALEADKKQLNLEVRMEGKQDGPSVICDEVRLKQILVNLVSNAVKFTPEGGRVSLVCRIVEETGNKIKLEFRVQDTGIGIEEEALQKIFCPYVQENKSTSRLYGGSGLGLALSRKLAELLGGQVQVESVRGKGSVFRVCLNLRKAGNKELMLCSTQENDFELGGVRILLAEDNDINREVMELLLTLRHAAVDCAVNGLETVRKYAASEKNTYDLILMDIQMPVMDGLAATRQIRRMPREDAVTVPIFALTANSYEEDVELEKRVGMSGHFTKPVDYNKLFEKIAEIRREKEEGPRN